MSVFVILQKINRRARDKGRDASSTKHPRFACPASSRLLMLLFVAGSASCIPAPEPTPVDRPEPPNDIVVVAMASASAAFEGGTITLTAAAGGGMAPYIYRWDQNGGPTTIELSVVLGPTISTPRLEVPGRYTFRVVVTDSRGRHATAYASVTVRQSVTASAPAFAIIGDPVALTATVDDEAEVLSTLWEVTQGTATISDPTALSPTLTAMLSETVKVRFTASIPVTSGEPVSSMQEFAIVSIAGLRPRVVMETNQGDITLELDGEAAPGHMVNFLLYVDEGFYDGLLFHRIVCVENEPDEPCEPFVIQGGGFERVGEELELREPTRDPIMREDRNGLSNGTLYSVALALTGGDPNSGQTQFFINLDEDNGFLDDQGFTVFAQVVEGTEIVDAITALPTTDSPFLPGEMSLPVDDVVIERMRRADP